MGENNLFGKNIRALRNQFKESQQELADILNVVKTTISNYENGKRDPDWNMLNNIANHYLVSVDDIVNKRLYNIRLDDSVFDMETQSTIFLKFFPIVSSKKAENNIHFVRALKKHNDIYSRAEKQDMSELIDVIDCIDGYLQAMDDDDSSVDACSNILGIYCLLYYMFVSAPQFINENSAALVRMKKENIRFKKDLTELSYDQSFFEDLAETKKLLNNKESLKLVTAALKILKKSERADLADYYIALRYIFGMVNENNNQLNREIGFCLMETFSEIGNVYAKLFMDI